MTENQRLKILLKELNFKNQAQFAAALELTPGTMSDILREKPGVGVSGNTKRKLENSYNVNIDWLETGIGPMFKTDDKKSALHGGVSDYQKPAPMGYDENSTALRNEPKNFAGVPMYNIPASASVVEMYGDANDVRIVGHLTIPGATKDSFALPVHGHSMYPTLENGSWCVLRPLTDTKDIEWGEIYYIEYGDYRMFKRLLQVDDEESVMLWSDNQSEIVNNRPKYAPKIIKLEKIKRLCLLTDILKKPNY